LERKVNRLQKKLEVKAQGSEQRRVLTLDLPRYLNSGVEGKRKEAGYLKLGTPHEAIKRALKGRGKERIGGKVGVWLGQSDKLRTRASILKELPVGYVLGKLVSVGGASDVWVEREARPQGSAGSLREGLVKELRLVRSWSEVELISEKR
jgi:hypothetical protein